MVGGSGIDKLAETLPIKDIVIKRCGEDIMIEGYVHRDS